MPNKKSAIKRVRQNEKRRVHNRTKRSDMRTHVKSARAAVEEKKFDGLETLVATAQSKLAKAAKTNLIKKNTAARKTSRLMKAAHKAKTASA